MMLNRREKKMLKDLLKIINDYELDKTAIARAAGFSHGGLLWDWEKRGSANMVSVEALKAALIEIARQLETATVDDLDDLPLRKTYLARQLGISQSNLSAGGRQSLSKETKEKITELIEGVGKGIESRMAA